MKITAILTVIAAAALASAASAASPPLTLASSAPTVVYGKSVTLSGVLTPPKANQQITVQALACGTTKAVNLARVKTAANGSYDMQTTPEKNDYRGQFLTAADGSYVLKSVKPRGYYIPMDGPVGEMIHAQKRHGMRPAHIHFLIGAVGYRELVTALYLAGDPHLADDVVFGSSGDLAVDIAPDDPECPIKGVPSIRFDMRLSRESAADKISGRVGADPSAILKPQAAAG